MSQDAQNSENQKAVGLNLMANDLMINHLNKLDENERYEYFNALLLNHYFGARDGKVVTELDVSDRELSLALPLGVGRFLLQVVRAKIIVNGDAQLRRDWTFNAQIGAEPKYFAFLIATCRIEWERENGEFNQALSESLGVAPAPWIQLIPPFWEGLKSFLNRQRGNDADHRTIELPGIYQHFTNIGYTVGLVFPRRSDRRKLEGMFADYTDTAPPLAQVVQDLQRINNQLSRECRTEATYFCENPGKLADERVRRFSEVLSKSLRNVIYQIHDDEAMDEPVFNLAIWIDEDGISQPWLLQINESETPDRFCVAEGFQGLSGWSRVIKGEGNNPSATGLFRDLDADPAYVHLSSFVQAALKRGLLPVAKVDDLMGGTCYKPADSDQADIAAYLVRGNEQQVGNEGSIAICDTGWSLVFDRIEPAGNDEIRLRPAAPKITVKGVKSGGAFIVNSLSEPIVSCDSAVSIKAVQADRAEDLIGDGIGNFTGLNGFEGEVQLTAYDTGENAVCRRRIQLVQKIAATVPAKFAQPHQSFWLSSGRFAEGARTSDSSLTWFGEADGGIDEPPTIETWLNDDVWLGPRVGDVSSCRKEGFEWRLSESIDSQKRVLYFDGDIDNPTPPNHKETNANKSACRLWRRAFDSSGKKFLEPAWQPHFEEFSKLKDPQRVRVLLNGDSPVKFDGERPAERRQTIEHDLPDRVSEKVGELERLISAKASSINSPLEWEFIYKSFENAFKSSAEGILDIMRAWHEIGVFEIAGMPWRGTVVIPRKPRFLSWRNGNDLVARLVGLTWPELRQAVIDLTNPDWLTTIYSVCEFAPTLLQIKTSDIERGRDHISMLVDQLELDPEECLPWRETQLLPPCLDNLNDIKAYFTKTDGDLPVSPPVFSKQIGRATIKKVKPHGQAPQWIVSAEGWNQSAICSANSWASHLASLVNEGTIPFRFSNGKFSRRNAENAPGSGQYLPLQAARILTVLSNILPGPVGKDYLYHCPTDLTGKVIADRLAIGKKN